jgi:hypothetical protein
MQKHKKRKLLILLSHQDIWKSWRLLAIDMCIIFIMVHSLQSSIMHVIFNMCIFVRIKLMEQIDISGYIISYVLCKYVAILLYIRWVGITTFYMKCDLDQFQLWPYPILINIVRSKLTRGLAFIIQYILILLVMFL